MDMLRPLAFVCIIVVKYEVKIKLITCAECSTFYECFLSNRKMSSAKSTTILSSTIGFIQWFIFLAAFNQSIAAAPVDFVDGGDKFIIKRGQCLSQTCTPINLSELVDAPRRGDTKPQLVRLTYRQPTNTFQTSLPTFTSRSASQDSELAISQQSLPPLDQCEAALKPDHPAPNKALFGKEGAGDEEIVPLHSYAAKYNLDDVG